MSQWGVKKTVRGATFIPLISTRAFAVETLYSVISGVIITDCGGDKAMAVSTLEELEERYVGEPYGAWLTSTEQKNCSHCRHWAVNDSPIAPNNHRACQNPALECAAAFGINIKEHRELPSNDRAKTGSLYTSEDFGCSHWKANQ